MKMLLRLIGYGWRQKWYLAGAYVAMGGATLSAIAIPGLLGASFDKAVTSEGRNQLLVYAGGILFASLIRGVFGYGQTYLSEAVSQRAAFDLRNDIFRKLQSLSFGFYDREQTGNLMSKATADVEGVRRFIGSSLISMASIFLTFVGVAAILFVMNWRLGLVSLSVVPLVMWLAIRMMRRLHDLWGKMQAERGHMTAVLQENLTGVRVVKAFGAGAYEQVKFEKRAFAVKEHTYSASVFSALRGAQMALIFTAMTGVILWFGGREVVSGNLTEGGLAAFILYQGMLMMPVRRLGGLINSFSRASAAGQRLFEVLDADSPVQEKPGAKRLPRVRGHVKFEKVSLSYDGSGQAIRDVDFEVQPGQLVAIMGGPGSGKSTIVHLVPRFYDVSAGRITIDGVDVRDVTLASLRHNVGIVLQDVFLFGATIRDNIGYGVDNASLEEVERAAQVAQLHEFVDSLPRGYDTWVGERGVTLSGGQRQRLAIARTILLDPPILILDDSTSSVDVGTEALIQQALSEVIKGRTVFVIAHRLSTVRKADQILVLDHGEIIEHGTHQELLGQDGFYRRIYDLQLRPQEDAAAQSSASPVGGDI